MDANQKVNGIYESMLGMVYSNETQQKPILHTSVYDTSQQKGANISLDIPFYQSIL